MQIPAAMLAATAGLLVLAVLAWLVSRALQRASGLPGGRITYADHGVRARPEKPLYDAALALTGKPDYLVTNEDGIIPMEVKSMWAPFSPYDSHLLQLGAYCLLVQKKHNRRPPYGLLRYRNRTFRIPFTPDLEQEVLDAVADIRSLKEREEIDRSHAQPNRCAGCAYRHICDQRL